MNECGVNSTHPTALALPEAARVDVDAAMSDGLTALMAALDQKQETVACWLVRGGKANVEIGDMDGNTALMRACHYDLLSSVRCLVLDGGADVAAQDEHGYGSGSAAAARGQEDILSFLVLEAKVVDVEDRNRDGVPLLGIAAMHGKLECARWLVEHAHADVLGRCSKGYMAHHYAAIEGYVPVLQYLVQERKAPVEAKAAMLQNTALHVAVWLVGAAGADIHAKDKKGRSPKGVAEIRGHDECAE